MSSPFRVELTDADFFDLAAGLSFNTLGSGGVEVILYGDDLTEDEIGALVDGKEVTYEGREGDYVLSAGDAPWGGNHDDAELAELWSGPYAPRLRLLGLTDPTLPPEIETPGVRQRLSALAVQPELETASAEPSVAEQSWDT